MNSVVIVGRPNVGKSTLFNRLIRKEHHLMDNRPGITRDRLAALCEIDDLQFELIDTGGWIDQSNDTLDLAIARQAENAINDADIVLFVVDGSVDVTALDEEFATRLRKLEKKIILIINKEDRKDTDAQKYQYYQFGFDTILSISAAHRIGIETLRETIAENLQKKGTEKKQIHYTFTILGRPNVGKSTLVNSLLQEERVMVDAKPGTTRDPVETILKWHGTNFRLIDTAGIRRGAKQEDRVERWSSKRAIQAIDQSDIVFLMTSAPDGITDGDQKVAALIAEAYKPAILLINKWDQISEQERFVKIITNEIDRKLHFLDYAPVMFISAKTGQRVSKIIPMANEILSTLHVRLNAAEVNLLLKEALVNHPPPRWRNRAVDVGPAEVNKGSTPLIIIKTIEPKALEDHYRRYLFNFLRTRLKLDKLPLRIVYRRRKKKKKRQ